MTIFRTGTVSAIVGFKEYYSHFIREIHQTGFNKMACSSYPKQKLIAVCQMTATNNKQENIKTCLKLIKSAKDKNCTMTFLPEACDYVGQSKEETLSLAEPLHGETIKTFCDVAKEYEMWLSLGGFHEQASNGKVQNSHILIDSSGTIAAVYRKTHLFDVDLPEQGIRLMESDYVIPGDVIVEPVETPVGNVALSVCYDMRFPELNLTLSKMKADILTFPSAFTYVTGAAHWQTILQARAVESQCYVVAAAQTGSHNEKRISWGHAMVVDPWGTVICQCTEGTNIAIAEIKLDYSQQVRTSIPVWKHRRTDIYHDLSPRRSLDNSTKYEFCNKILNEETIVYKTEQTLAFMSCSPVLPGHVLVIPLRKVSKLSDLNVDETADLFLVVQRIQNAFAERYSTKANTVFMKEECDHLHIHLLPRRATDFEHNDVVYLHLENHSEVASPSESLKHIFSEAKTLKIILNI